MDMNTSLVMRSFLNKNIVCEVEIKSISCDVCIMHRLVLGLIVILSFG